MAAHKAKIVRKNNVLFFLLQEPRELRELRGLHKLDIYIVTQRHYIKFIVSNFHKEIQYYLGDQQIIKLLNILVLLSTKQVKKTKI